MVGQPYGVDGALRDATPQPYGGGALRDATPPPPPRSALLRGGYGAAPSSPANSFHSRNASPAASLRAKKWQDAYAELQEEEWQARDDLVRHCDEETSLALETERLRQQFDQEKAETSVAIAQFTKRIDSLTQDNRKLEMKLMRTQSREAIKDTEAATVKKEVLEKTKAIEQVMRDLEQKQRDALSRVKSIAKIMLMASSSSSQDTANSSMGRSCAGAFGTSLGGGVMLEGTVSSLAGRPGAQPGSNHASEHFGGIGPRSANLLAAPLAGYLPAQPLDTAAAGASSDTKAWAESIKANLEHFGDVQVFHDTSTRECPCCMEMIDAAYRIRPRKCLHVFHIECLLQWWTEGTCPICSVSFAPEDSASISGGRGPPRSSGAAAQPAGLPGPNTFGGLDLLSALPPTSFGASC